MDSAKYIGLDVHKESISIAVMNAAGKIIMECVIETKAITVVPTSVPVCQFKLSHKGVHPGTSLSRGVNP